MQLVSDESIFYVEQCKVNTLVDFKVQFPDQIFRKNFADFLFVDFDDVYSAYFFGALIRFLGFISEEGFKLLVTTPSPDDYFYENFNKYPLLEFAISDSSQNYVNALAQDPGSSPADAILFNSDVVVLYSESSDYCIYANRDLGFAIVGCISREIALKFLNSYSIKRVWSESYIYEKLTPQFTSEESLSSFKKKFTENYNCFNSIGGEN